MNSLNLSLGALSVYVTAALLSGCGGSQLPVAAPGAVPQNVATMPHGSRPISAVRSDSKLSGETFTSIKVKSYCAGNKVKQTGDFHARGTASGPFSGTFTARGQAAESEARGEPSLWYLDEHFTLTSGSQEISGHVKTGNAGKDVSCSKHTLSFEISSFPYKLKGYRGGTASATLGNGASGQTFTESFK